MLSPPRRETTQLRQALTPVLTHGPQTPTAPPARPCRHPCADARLRAPHVKIPPPSPRRVNRRVRRQRALAARPGRRRARGLAVAQPGALLLLLLLRHRLRLLRRVHVRVPWRRRGGAGAAAVEAAGDGREDVMRLRGTRQPGAHAQRAVRTKGKTRKTQHGEGVPARPRA